MQRFALAMLCVCWPAVALAGEINFPYTAFVESGTASVLSGPGVEFYATERLKWGTKVEVYRHEEKWAAIRPPADSFSWVPASVVEETPNPRLVTVNQPDTFTRVGTQFSDKHTAEYIELKVGESLEVLGRKFMANDSNEVVEWLKIAPPAGEFRWIRLNALSLTPPVAKAKPKSPAVPKIAKAKSNDKTTIAASDSKESITEDKPKEPELRQPEFASMDDVKAESNDSARQPRDSLVERYPKPAQTNEVEVAETPSEPEEESAWQVVSYDEPSTPDDEAQQGTIGSSVRRLAEGTPALARKLREKLSGLSDLLSPPETRQFPEFNRDPIQDPNVQQAQWFSESTSPRPSLDVPPQAAQGWREVDEFSSTRVASRTNHTVRPTSIHSSSSGQVPVPTVGPIPPPSNLLPMPMHSPAAHFASADISRYRTLPSIKSSLVATPPNHDITPITANVPVPARPPIVGINDRNLLNQELMAIDLELAETVTQPPANWSLELLRIRAQAVIDASQIVDIRDRGQRVLAKIAQFEDVQRRERQMVLTGRVDPMPSSAVLASLPRSATNSPESVLASNHFPNSQRLVQSQRTQNSMAPTQVAFASAPPSQSSKLPPTGAPSARPISYDGQGWLMPVVTSRTGMPRYALTDDNGNVIQFISPQPGLNLSSYVRKRIGVFGQRSYLANVEKPHLTAERIVSMRQVR